MPGKLLVEIMINSSCNFLLRFGFFFPPIFAYAYPISFWGFTPLGFIEGGSAVCTILVIFCLSTSCSVKRSIRTLSIPLFKFTVLWIWGGRGSDGVMLAFFEVFSS